MAASLSPKSEVALLQTLDVYAPPATLKSIPREIVLYQYENCPFCCKVKAFLDFHKVCGVMRSDVVLVQLCCMHA